LRRTIGFSRTGAITLLVALDDAIAANCRLIRIRVGRLSAATAVRSRMTTSVRFVG
jgi:hypothetical protein